MVDSDRIDKLIAAVPSALAFSPDLAAARRVHTASRLRSASRPIVCRDCFVIFRNADTTTVLRTGLTAAAVTHD
ncbi:MULTISPECIES: hypothetical protein [Aminobacter]|uniref:Uncharacterized protein n=1 Tax=Aminobacter aminovorans TaxID=83263 RepID=A0AAC9APW5_AMIAI|nr:MULTISPECIES: hypothetical protein [Aminobacter]AMS39466.1 hypothetical protein AA2016_0527 [Aminobacter aminovorans]MBB3707613.1 hypothetical protein [Aminobacter aminovorans]QNH34942.1 hypothetical protein H5P29_03080 [Aminobacter sp. MDW-2]